MGDIFNSDFQDFLIAVNKHEVDYVLIGGYVVNYYGYNRTTADMDLYVKPTSENFTKIAKAFEDFGLSTFDMTKQNFLNTDDFDVFVFGRAPVRIEIITKVNGLSFERALSTSIIGEIDRIPVRLLTKSGLLSAKEIAGRHKDLEDIRQLKMLSEEE